MTLVPATAVAHPNIALVKYWGKRDEELVLPMTGSLSLTLDVGATTTTVGPAAGTADEVLLGGQELVGVPRDRVVAFLDLVRTLAGRTDAARVETTNTIPTGAGLASSASGFAALALAAATAHGLDLDRRDLSRLARRGSGSASRSVYGGLVEWLPGTDDATSYAQPVPSALELGMVMVVLEDRQKPVSSRVAMRRTVETSPFYPAWVEHNPGDLAAMRDALAAGDLETVGDLTERNALRMHATMLGAVPPVLYWTPATLRLLAVVQDLRRAGTGAWATMDAGPNVKVLCAAADRDAVAAALREATPGTPVLVGGHGPGAHLAGAGPDAPAGHRGPHGTTADGARP